MSLKRAGRKSVGTAHKTTPKFHPSDVSGTRTNKTFHFYISSEFPLMSRSPRASSQSVHTSCLVTGTKSTGLDPSKILIAFHASIQSRWKERDGDRERERGKITGYDFKAHKQRKKKKKKKEEIRQRVSQRVGENQCSDRRSVGRREMEIFDSLSREINPHTSLMRYAFVKTRA